MAVHARLSYFMNTTLYYREGSSDKVYQCRIEPSGTGFVVNFAYGRRGSTLSTGTKTSSPVAYETAKTTYDKLVREKRAKGYTEGADGTPYQNTDQQPSGLLPQLLNPIEMSEVADLLENNDWAMQEKLDGKRLLLRKHGAAIHGINRKGLLVGLPSPLVVEVAKIPHDFVMDGECIGEVLYVFDLLSWKDQSLAASPYQERLKQLIEFVESDQFVHLKLVETAYNTRAKARLYARLQDGKREGAVFKRLAAPYTPGRPNSGGDQLKYKFTATVSAVVAKINSQRSVELRLLGKSGWVTAGNVTIPANQSIPEVEAIVEVRYLYAFPESGVLCQPVYLGLRNDVDTAECTTTQLKFKPTE